MSNHFSAANLKHPGDDARLDLTDLFVFAAPGNPDRTVLIMDSNPFLEGNGFHPDAVYRFNIDNNGDSLADVAFSVTFSEMKDGRQTARVHYAKGSEAQSREPRGALQMEREGNPSFNPILNPDSIKNEFNATDPVDDVKNHLKPLSETLERHGYSPDEARAAALTLLPDILHYDRTKPAHYPNGRVMTDDVFSARMIMMVHGQARPQDVKPHKDLMPEFPFLGIPHPVKAGAVTAKA